MKLFLKMGDIGNNAKAYRYIVSKSMPICSHCLAMLAPALQHAELKAFRKTSCTIRLEKERDPTISISRSPQGRNRCRIA